MTPASAHDDVLIIGGGPAGLTAALYLGRARLRTVVVDRGAPRHAVSSGVHNFLTRDGMPPAALRSEAWRQMAAYPSVRHVGGVDVEALDYADGLWSARCSDGQTRKASAVLLATGVVDLHPDIPGFAERWGRAIFHCPFCHGWEVRDLPLAIVAPGPAGAHLVPLARQWSDDVALLTHGTPADAEARAVAERLGVPIHEAPIAALEGSDGTLKTIRFADGRVIAREAMFYAGEQRQVPLVQRLDLALDDMGYVRIDAMGLTNRPKLWAAGDLTGRGNQQVVIAAGQGARAAVGIVASRVLAH